MRKIFASLIAFFALSFAECVFALELPNQIGEWHEVSTNILPLITTYNNESHGRVVYATYKRESPSAFLDVILTEGSGTGNLYVPEKVNDSEGMMKSDSGFEVVKVSGHDAIIESQSFMPLVLAVNVGDNITLNLESPSANREELMRVAEEILAWKNTSSDSFPAPSKFPTK